MNWQSMLKAYKSFARIKKQPLSWITDEAIEDFLNKNGISVTKSEEEKYKR